MPATNPSNAHPAPPPRSRPGAFRWGLAIVLLVLAGWTGWQAYRAHAQRSIREYIEEQGGAVAYDYESRELDREASQPGTIAGILGNDYTQDIVEATLRNTDRSSITDDDLTKVSTLSALEKLSISNGAEVTDEGLAALAGMPKLRILKLVRFAQVTDAGMAVLAKLPALRELELIEIPKISDGALEHAAALENLKKVTINKCRINGSGLQHIKPGGLVYVDATSCDLNDEALKHLAGAADLDELAASENKIRGTGLAHLKGLTKLTKLRLAQNPLEPTTALANLKALESLEILNLSETPIDRKGGEELSQALPKCDITITGGNYDPEDDGGKWRFGSGE
jgi:hypothetical protein